MENELFILNPTVKMTLTPLQAGIDVLSQTSDLQYMERAVLLLTTVRQAESLDGMPALSPVFTEEDTDMIKTLHWLIDARLVRRVKHPTDKEQSLEFRITWKGVQFMELFRLYHREGRPQHLLVALLQFY